MLNTIVVGTDGSATATKAVEMALEIAEKFGATLVVASSFEAMSSGEIEREMDASPKDAAWAVSGAAAVDSYLGEIVDVAKSRGVEAITAAHAGDPVDVLCDVAGRQKADLLIVGSKGMQRRLLGSVPNSVAHRAPCSVMIAHTT